MILVRPGGIFGVLVALVVAAIFMFVVRPAIDDTTNKAFDTANRALDSATKQTQDLQSSVAKATAAGNGDYLASASFAPVVQQLKARLGAGAELLDLTVTKQGGGNVKYRTGDHAAGYQWGPGHDGLAPVKVTLVGSGKLSDNVFPIARLHADATAKLTAAVRAKAGAGFKIQSMTLGLNPVSGAVRWTVTGEGGGRALVYSAGPDATHLQKLN